MAELDDFMKNITKLVKAMETMDKSMVKLAKSATKSSSSLDGGAKSMGSNSGNILANSFGLSAPISPNDPNRRSVRTAAFFGKDDDTDYYSSRNSGMGRAFKKRGMGEARFSASNGDPLTQGDMDYNQSLAETQRDKMWNKRMGVSGAGGAVSRAFGFQGITRQEFGQLPTSSQNLISSAMPTPQDSLNLMSGIQNATSTFLPDVGKAMTRATGYYNATRAGGNQINRSRMIANTFDTMNSIGGISSVGSDANVAEYLASRGMTSSGDENSTYQQTIRATAQASKYMNISNEQAVQSIEGLTSGQGSGNMLKQLGIYTADLKTGKEKTQGQIFEEVAQRLTAGRRGASVEQTQASIRRGTLGSTISGLFQDETTQNMFKQYMIDRAGGKSMDLSYTGAMNNIYGGQADSNRNPLNAQMTLNANETEALGMAQDEYIKGMEAATLVIGGLQKAAGAAAATMMGFPNALLQTLMGNSQVKGLTQGAQSIASYASKGIAGIQEAIIGGEYDTPQGAIVAGATVAAIGAASLAGAVPAMASTGAQLMLGVGSKGFSSGSTGQPNGAGKTVNVGGLMGGGTGGQINGTGGDTPSSDNVRFFDPTNTQQLNEGGGYLAGVHNGYDYQAPFPPGRPVYAVYDGEVRAAAKTTGPKGTHIIIDHGNIKGKNVYSHYYHLSELLVSPGQSVKGGDRIGTSGATGAGITGPHLHVAIAEGGMHSFVNPGKYLKATGGSGAYARTGKKVPDASGGGNSISAAQSIRNDPSGSSGIGSLPTDAASANTYVSGLMSAAKPGADAQGAINLLTQLSSGNTSTIMAAVRGMSSGFGVSLNPSATYANTYGISKNSTAGAATAAALVGKSTGTGNTVNITVQVPDTSPTEAEKFARLVKQFLEDNTLQTNTMKA